MAQDWARIRYKPGEVVGKCEYVADRPTWKKQTMGIFKCLQEGCGKEFISPTRLVRDQRTVSCGCLKHRTVKKAAASKRTHGLSGTPMYKRWHQIKTRCFNTKNKQYKDYGGRGIVMCDEWKDDFMKFYEYITALPGYNEADVKGHVLSLDRIDNDKGYEPGNIRWATSHQQSVNVRNDPRGAVGFRGVWMDKRRYMSSITVDGQPHYLGSFKTPESAVMARDMYIIKHGLWEYNLQAVGNSLINN